MNTPPNALGSAQPAMMKQLFDVVAVNIRDGKITALFSERKTASNAGAIVKMAILRRGVEEQFYAEVPTGKFKAGDTYSHDEPTPAAVRRNAGAERRTKPVHPRRRHPFSLSASR